VSFWASTAAVDDLEVLYGGCAAQVKEVFFECRGSARADLVGG
jgi:hypothetical protein